MYTCVKGQVFRYRCPDTCVEVSVLRYRGIGHQAQCTGSGVQVYVSRYICPGTGVQVKVSMYGCQGSYIQLQVCTPACRYAQQLVRANQRREQYYTVSLPGVLEALHGINLARGEAWQQVPGTVQ